MITEPIILIGPMKTGKSVVGRLLAAQLNQTFTSLDALEHHYTRMAGFDDDVAAKLQTEEGDLAWYSYRRRFFDEAVVRFLAEYREGVLELGGGHPIAPEATAQQRINDALAPFPNVVLLMPTPDKTESLAILRQRQKPERRNPDLNELFLQDDHFSHQAKFTLYTFGKSPEETCAELITALQAS